MIETINYKGIKIEIEQDEIAENPRTEWDHASKMICFHGRYNLGDKHEFENPSDLQEFLTKTNAVHLPLYLYDHGGLTISTGSFSCQWDSGQVGYIYMTNEAFKEFYGEKIDDARILEILKGDVETYDNFLTGNIYGFNIPGIDCNCYGFYGYDHEKSGLLEDAKSDIDYYLRNKKQVKDKEQLLMSVCY